MVQVDILGHRAYRGLYPENTLLAFDKAYEAGVDVIETDLQMSADGIVVVNHDATTGRIWNRDYTIGETKWEELQTLRCNDPKFADQRMPSFVEALKWAVEHPRAKLMLDIKFTNDKIILIKSFADMLKVKNDLAYWKKHIIWGLWTVDWYAFGVQTGILNDFPLVCITLSLHVAKSFVEYSKKLDNPHYKLSGVSLHFVSTWSDQFQQKWLPYLKENNVRIYVWTINHEIDFKYCNALPISGFVTDYPLQARSAISKYKRSDTVFQKPKIGSKEGLRFYAFLTLYSWIAQLLFSPWSQYKVIGQWSFSYLMLKLLKLIHFL
ncbi:LAFE_0C04544g1_1 [Lachancea fermentati]|uniref:LAFE_0C04544g1_1 n=1 Tax=Lachancea fermentati TaxID=4955 RepID=A0A1G4M9M3_LACFM|nr:LAFE_0C04544g1_1 [Lachancea fermentati]